MKIWWKKYIIGIGGFLFLLGIFLNFPGNVCAAVKKVDFLNSYDKTTCKIDLDGDSVSEMLELNTLLDDYIYIKQADLYINGKKALALNNNQFGDATYIGIDYVKMTNSNIFLRVAARGESDVIYMNCFYRYKPSTGKMVKAGNLLGVHAWCADAVIQSVSSSDIKIQYRQQFYEMGAVK